MREIEIPQTLNGLYRAIGRSISTNSHDVGDDELMELGRAWCAIHQEVLNDLAQVAERASGLNHVGMLTNITSDFESNFVHVRRFLGDPRARCLSELFHAATLSEQAAPEFLALLRQLVK